MRFQFPPDCVRNVVHARTTLIITPRREGCVHHVERAFARCTLESLARSRVLGNSGRQTAVALEIVHGGSQRRDATADPTNP